MCEHLRHLPLVRRVDVGLRLHRLLGALLVAQPERLLAPAAPLRLLPPRARGEGILPELTVTPGARLTTVRFLRHGPPPIRGYSRPLIEEVKPIPAAPPSTAAARRSPLSNAPAAGARTGSPSTPFSIPRSPA